MLLTTTETIQGRTLRFSRIGQGPPLLLLHGYPDNLQIWSRLAPKLAQHFEVIAFDWPGMGYSEAWPGGTTPEHMADRLLSLIDHWKLERISLLGIDMGGQPALVFSAKYPERVTQLIVMNCLAFGDEKTSWEIRILRKFGWNRFILNHFPRLVFWRVLQTFLPRHQPLSTDLKKDIWESFRRPEVRQFISKMCVGYQGTLAQLPQFYVKIRCPLLILWGKQDPHFPEIHAHKLQQLLPQAQLEILPEGEHWLIWHDSERVAQLILEKCNKSPYSSL